MILYGTGIKKKKDRKRRKKSFIMGGVKIFLLEAAILYDAAYHWYNKVLLTCIGLSITCPSHMQIQQPFLNMRRERNRCN